MTKCNEIVSEAKLIERCVLFFICRTRRRRRRCQMQPVNVDGIYFTSRDVWNGASTFTGVPFNYLFSYFKALVRQRREIPQVIRYGQPN